MKLVQHRDFIGILLDDRVYSLENYAYWTKWVDEFPTGPEATDWDWNMNRHRQPVADIIEWLKFSKVAAHLPQIVEEVKKSPDVHNFPLSGASLRSPLTNATSLRDFYAFEQHVATAFANRGAEVPKEWYEIPVFYFSNHSAIFGHDDTIPYPRKSSALDYELEVACVIGKAGMDIQPENALDHIFGFTIMNDWSARDVQRQEMRVGLGPAKGKDFATSLGPWLVTPDELADRAVPGKPGVYDLTMIARVNGVERSCGNWKDLYYSFGDMIARASEGVMLRPGDVIGSGTVGTGCLLEITKGQGPWLQPGDVVELEIERLGILRNTVGAKS